MSEINIIIHFGVSVVIFVGRRCTVASSRAARRWRRWPCLPNRRTAKAILRPYSPPRLFDVCDHFYAMLVRWLLPYTARNLSLQNSKITMYYSGSLNVSFLLFCIKIRLPQNLSCHKKELLFSTNNNVHRLPDWKILQKRNCSIYLALWSKYLKNFDAQCTI